MKGHRPWGETSDACAIGYTDLLQKQEVELDVSRDRQAGHARYAQGAVRRIAEAGCR